YRLMPVQVAQPGICAPHLDDAALHGKIAELRAAGDVVVVDLLGNAACRDELQCDRQLVLRDGVWQVVAL
ncbi:MAG TPA: ATP phosphoribosyltransferase regulatory subunit, partial [Gallionella sp.]|nr:ATP phosphoribosyltransferase regulatory subunit [Gallionella sp.]